MQVYFMNRCILITCRSESKLRFVLIINQPEASFAWELEGFGFFFLFLFFFLKKTKHLEAFCSLMLFMSLRLWIIYMEGWTKNSLWWISAPSSQQCEQGNVWLYPWPVGYQLNARYAVQSVRMYGIFVFSETTLEPCTMWAKWQCMTAELTFWPMHQRISKISISRSWSKIAVILLGFKSFSLSKDVHTWPQVFVHSAHSNPFLLPQPLTHHKFSSCLYFYAALSEASKTGCILRTTHKCTSMSQICNSNGISHRFCPVTPVSLTIINDSKCYITDRRCINVMGVRCVDATSLHQRQLWDESGLLWVKLSTPKQRSVLLLHVWLMGRV